MGLDIYVGSLTRYHRGDWETVVQEFAKSKGIPFNLVRLNRRKKADEEPPLPEETVRNAVLNWRNQLNNGLRQNLAEPFDWDESGSSPYFTDKPAWDCYGGLLLLTAYYEHQERNLPSVVPDRWHDDRILSSSLREDSSSDFFQLLGPEVWLPCNFNFTFKTELVTGKTVQIGSSCELLGQLRKLNESTLKGTSDDFIAWRKEGAEYGGPFEQSAKMGMAVMIALAQESIKHKLPMLLDY
jgi:hypothetical protein